MTDKEKLDAIRAEIHRLVDVRGYDRGMANDLFAFMNSLPNEPISEDLKEASRNYADNEEYGDDVYFAIKAAFKAGANWQKQQTIDKAAEWLKCAGMYRWYDPIEHNEGFGTGRLIEDFKKYMED